MVRDVYGAVTKPRVIYQSLFDKGCMGIDAVAGKSGLLMRW